MRVEDYHAVLEEYSPLKQGVRKAAHGMWERDTR
jgi:hypothetical protein